MQGGWARVLKCSPFLSLFILVSNICLLKHLKHKRHEFRTDLHKRGSFYINTEGGNKKDIKINEKLYKMPEALQGNE